MINCIWILNTNGICLAQRNYTPDSVDPILFSGLINAIQTFSKKVTNTAIESFQTADQKILYDISDIILAINVEIEDDDAEIRRKMTEVKEKFLSKYGKQIQQMSIQMLNTDIFAEFEKDISTMGVDFLIKNLKIGEDGIKIIVWDIGGQNQWREKLHLYLQGSDGAIIVMDLTRKKTLDGLDYWLEAIEKYLKVENFPIVLVGNKVDLVEQRKITSEALKSASKFPVFETSAKTGETVEDMFISVAERVLVNKKKMKKN